MSRHNNFDGVNDTASRRGARAEAPHSDEIALGQAAANVCLPKFVALVLVVAYAITVICTASAQPTDETPTDGETANVPEEPTSVTLADGTVVQLETYGDEYEGYEARLPITADKAETVVDYERDRLGTNLDLRSIRLDVKNKRMYWIDSDGGAWRFGNIRSAGLNGQSPTTLVGPKLKNPRGLELDLVHRMMYWSIAVQSETLPIGVQLAKLDGSRAATLIEVPSRAPGAVVIDTDADTLYYFDDAKLIRARLDGSDERLVIDATGKARFGWSAVIDHSRKQLYWCGGDDRIARVNLDGSGLETVVALGSARGSIWGIALDATNDKLYWVERSYAHVFRANLDGSRMENLVVGLKWPGGVDVDLEHGYVYWTARRNDGGTLYGLVQRAKIPPVPISKTMQAPPRIVAVDPTKGTAGSEVTLRGNHFTGVERVEFVGDGGERLRARFSVKSDRELRVVVPNGPKGVQRAAVVVVGPGGVAVALSHDCRNMNGRNPLDRFRDARASPFILSPGSDTGDLENCMAVATATSHFVVGGRGGNVVFMKNGSCMVPREGSTNVIYFEPFARIAGRHEKASPRTTLIPVPAIRLSFVESLFEYER